MAFSEDLKKYVDIAVDKTRDAFGKGKKAVSKFGDDSAIRIEKLHYERKARQEIATLGKLVFKVLSEEKQPSVSASDELIAASLRTIEELNAEIARRAELLKKDDAEAKKDGNSAKNSE